MAVTVRSQVLKLALRVDPRTKAQVEFVGATIGTVAGNRFAAQRLLDIYNEARVGLAGAIRVLMPPEKRATVISGLILRSTSGAPSTFTSGVLTLPAGFIDHIALRTSADVDIPILPSSVLQIASRHDAAANPFVFREGGTLKVLPGSTSVPDASDYEFWYYGVTDFTLTDVTNGTSLETYNDDLLPRLLNIAERIANAQGNYDPNAIAFDEIQKG